MYTGKTANELVAKKATLDLYCSITTKTVMGFLQKTKLLYNHLTVFLTTTSICGIVRRNDVQGDIQCR